MSAWAPAARRRSSVVWLAVWCALGCSRDGQPPPAVSVERARAAPSAPSAPRSGARREEAPLPEAASSPEVAPSSDGVLGPARLQPGERFPLLVVLHGLGGSGASSVRVLDLAPFAERERVLVLAPDGSEDSRGRRFWNAHPACCDFEASGIDHVRALAARIDAVVHSSPVDEQRVFVAGFSNGGFMALKLACELGTRLRAVASIAGAGPGPEASACSAQLPHVLLVHGDRDVTVRYAGGSVFDHPGLPRHGSALETFREWAARAGCRSEVEASPFDAIGSIPGDETAPLLANGCRSGGVRLWTVHQGTHAIGGSGSLFERVWEFFEEYSERP